MTQHGLKLPPHLLEAAKQAEAQAERRAERQADALEQPLLADSNRPDARIPRPTTVETPLGSVTCPPGRLKLNLLHGGMPPIVKPSES